MKENGERKAIDKDAELLKVQIYAERCHTKFTLFVSLLFGILIAFAIALFTLLHERHISFLQFSASFLFVFGFCFLYVYYTMKDYKESFKEISHMIEKVKEGEELPKLENLKHNQKN